MSLVRPSYLAARLIGSVERTKVEHDVRLAFGIMWMLAPLAIFIAAAFTTSDIGSTVPWRPPVDTYIVMWCFIILNLMVSWVLVNRKADFVSWICLLVGFFVTIGLAISWIFAFNENPSNGISVFIALLMVIGMMLPVLYKVDVFATALWMPLVVWAVFQLTVNCGVVAYPTKIRPAGLPKK